MMRKLCLLLLYLLTALGCHAQTAQDAAPAADKRYMGQVEIGYLYGKVHYDNQNSDLSAASPTVQVFNGYRLSRGFVVGATVGFDFYDNILVTPLALGIRGEVLDARVSPTYSLDAGYGATFLSDEGEEQKLKGGWLFNPAIGLRVRTGDSGSAFAFNIGYKTQRITSENNWWNNHIEQKINYKRLSLRMGFIF